MTDIKKLKELEAKAVAARIEYMNDLVDGPEKYHRCVNEYKNALYIEAPALLASLASKDAEIEELRVRLDRSRDEYHRKIDHDLMRARAERDEWKEACRRAGVCMSCATSNRDPMGCTDCMNTGWDGGSPMEARMAEDRADSAESRLTTALAALGEAKSGLVEIEAITPHKATRLCARAALAKLNEIERNADG